MGQSADETKYRSAGGVRKVGGGVGGGRREDIAFYTCVERMEEARGQEFKGEYESELVTWREGDPRAILSVQYWLVLYIYIYIFL